jgi:hypothetical protein
MRQCVSIAWAQGGQGRALGHTGCPGDRILGPNLRLKWVRADSFRHLGPFAAPPHWAKPPVQSDTIRHALSIWVGPLEMAYDSGCMGVSPFSLKKRL